MHKKLLIRLLDGILGVWSVIKRFETADSSWYSQQTNISIGHCHKFFFFFFLMVGKIRQVLSRCEQNLSNLSRVMYDELEDCEGELLINVPESCYDLMDQQKVVKVGIDVKVVNPKHVRFSNLFYSLYLNVCNAHKGKSSVCSRHTSKQQCAETKFIICV